MIFVEYDFEIKYCTKIINFANASFKQLDYENQINNEIYFFTLQNKLKNIIIVIVNLTSIIIRNIIKTFKSLIIKSVDTFRIKIEKIKKEIFEKNEKNLIDSIVIQQLRRSNARTACKIKKFIKFSFNFLTAKIEKFQNKNFVVNCVRSQLSQKRDNYVERN